MTSANSTVLARAATSSAIDQYEAITEVMGLYIAAIKTGNIATMKPAFHENAGFFGYFEGKLLGGPIQILFDVTEQNGPSPNLRAQITSVDIVETIAVVRLEMDNYTGKLAGNGGAHLSDIFSLVKAEGGWKISQKSFHWNN